MDKHSEHSSFRENLIEHLFIGELLKLSWKNGNCELEVSKPEVDNSGYDVIIESNKIVRHVQLKASYIGSSTNKQKVNVKLANKPSGCVVWICFDKNTLELGQFYFFGSKPGQPLPSLDNAKIARHNKGDKSGYKAERLNIRELKKGDFMKYKTVHDIYNVLFGKC